VKKFSSLVQSAWHRRGQHRNPHSTKASLSMIGSSGAPRANKIEDLIHSDADYQAIHAEVDKLLLPRLLEAHDHNLTNVAKRVGMSRDKLRARL
jgi:hypothetical protein